MENAHVLHADADVEPMSAHVPSQKSKPSHPGEGTMTAVESGLSGHSRTDEEDEATPLLGRSHIGKSPSGDGEGNAPGWSGAADFKGRPWWRTPSVYWMLPPFLLSTLAFGGVIVPRLNLILNLICREYIADRSADDPDFTMMPVVFGESNPQCRIPEVQARVAQFALYTNLIAGLLSAVTSPKLGALSDRYGRTKIMAMAILGSLLGDALTIFAATSPETFNVNWFFVGSFLDGLCGSFTAAMALAHSYATDTTPPDMRNVVFGYFHGCLFTGIALGPVIAGYIVKAAGTVSVFYIAFACHVVFISFLAFVIPESLTKTRQLAAREKHRQEREERAPSADWINRLRKFNILEPLKILYPTGEGTSSAVRRNLIVLASVDTIVFGVAMGSMTVVVIYSNFQFGWGTLEQSIFVSVVNTCRVCCLIIILPIITRLVRGKNASKQQKNSGSDPFDLSVIRFAIFFDTLGYLGYTLARKGSLFILSGAIASIGGIASPTLQSALTKHVPPDRTGQLLGASGLLHALARVVAPTIFNAIYSITVGKFTQTVFVCLTVVFGLAFVVSWFIRPYVHLEEPGEADSASQTGGHI